MNKSSDIILKGRRIILPRVYQNIAIKLARQGHLGIQKTKALLRSKIFMLDMDKMVEKEIANCIACQATSKPAAPAPIISTKLPKTVNADYLGPLPNGLYVFVIIDQRSKYPEVELVRRTKAEQLIPILDRIFATYGNPVVYISDNGPPFRSKMISKYMKSRGIKHQFVTPIWPQGNAEVERFMSPLMKTIRIAHIEGKDIRKEINNFLFAYRNTPHSSTKITPANVMSNRKIRHNIPDWTDKINQKKMNENLQENDKNSKYKSKHYMDNKHRSTNIAMKIGDRVLVK